MMGDVVFLDKDKREYLRERRDEAERERRMKRSRANLLKAAKRLKW